MWFAARKSTDWNGGALSWEDFSRKKKRLTEAEVLDWKEGGPRKSLKGRISRRSGWDGGHPGRCLNCCFAGP